MADAVTAPQRPVFTVGEENLLSVSYDGRLESGEVLTGTPTAIEKTTSDLTITNVSVSSTALIINNKSVAAGRAIQCFVVGHIVVNAPYTVNFTATTDSSPAQTKKGRGEFEVVAAE